MKNYRIIIERINDGPEGNDLPEELRGGIECSGFCLVSDDIDDDARSAICVQNMTTLAIARHIASCETLRAASCIAKALNEAQEIERKGTVDKLFNKLREYAEQKGK